MVIAVTKNSRSKEHNMQLSNEKSTLIPLNFTQVDNNIHPLVKLLNFEKLKWKLTKSLEATWSIKLCEFAESEYCKFLTLKKLHPKVALVPSKIVDKFWHEHILDTKAYADDCNKVFGHFIHHYPYFGIYGADDQNNLQSSFDVTIKFYEAQFGKFPTEALFGKESTLAARCDGDHACHVPSSCACRTPGACK